MSAEYMRMANQMNIPLIFYGEMPGEYGRKISHKQRKFETSKSGSSHKAYLLDPLSGEDFKNSYLGGKKVEEYLNEGISLNDLKAYRPLDPEIIKKKKIEFHWYGYYRRFVPQENYYFAVKKTNFSPNPERTEGTYSKYNSIDDKMDGFFYFTRFIKFGVGRAMMDSSQEIRNGHLTKEEGLALISKFDGEYPSKYEKEFLNYISMSKEEFSDCCDKFRPKHIWEKKSNRWELLNSPELFFKK